MKQISWDAALRNLEERHQREQTPYMRRFRANACSLSALFLPDFPSAVYQIKEAIALEPFDPLHRYRLALLYMRFGQWQDAQRILQGLVEQLPKFVLPLYLRGLLFLRTGETKRAVNIAGEIKLLNPSFVWARYLEAEARLRQTMRRAERYLRNLPKDEAYAAHWVDLLSKIIIAHPNEGAKFVQKFLRESKVLTKDSREEALIDQLVHWSTASAEDLQAVLGRLTPSSKAEQLVLLFLHDHLKKESNIHEYLQSLRQLYERFPQSRAVRRLYIAALNRHTVEEAAQSRYREALVAVEVCLRLEPYNPIHYQNRATLFTLLREREPYHHAWEEVDRHQYRLALMGRLDRTVALRIAARHRMFAQQARLPPSPTKSPYAAQLGILRTDQAMRNELSETVLRVNQDRIDADPELLRQWIHHRKAELFFSHLALGTEPDNFLLGYPDDLTAQAKLKSLNALGASLTILAGEEGELLANKAEKMWQGMVVTTAPTYALLKEEEELQLLSQFHIETLGDLALLCYQWEPNERDTLIVDELVDFLRTEAVFLDWQLLVATLKQQDGASTLTHLAHIVADTLDHKESIEEIAPAEQIQVTNRMIAHLLINLALDIYEESNERPKEAAHRALRVLERAREAAPDSAMIEYFAARFFFIGDFYEEARQAVARFYQLDPEQTSSYVSQIEEILKALDDVEKKNERQYIRDEAEQDRTDKNTLDKRIYELRTVLEQFPTSIQSYEELAHLLAEEGQFDSAIEWTERAIARCLSRRGQMKARTLNLEVMGIQMLGASYLNEIRIYLKGVYAPVKEALTVVYGEKPECYPLGYLLGMCWLAEGEPEEAQRTFQQALERCDRQLHFAVLRPLSADVEQALYELAKQAIVQAIEEQQFENAFAHVARIMKRLKDPAISLIDLASIQLSAVVTNLQFNVGVPQPPQITLTVSWQAKLAEALGSSNELERIRHLVQLAIKQHPASKQRGEEIIRQVAHLQTQIRVADGLSHSSQLFREEKWEAALEVLLSLGSAAETEPRVLRQRAMLLVKLERFAEADDIVKRLKSHDEDLAASFVESYPTIKFRQHIRIIQSLLRQGHTEAARERLSQIEIISEKANLEEARLEIAYCQAFALAIDGYRAIDAGANDQARQLFQDALDEIEPKIPLARQQEHTSLLDLYEKLTKDLTDLQETLYERV